MNSGRTRSSVISFGRISDSERVVVTSILLAVLRPRAGRRLIDYILKRIEAHLSAIDVNIDRLQLGSCANGKAAEGGAKSTSRRSREARWDIGAEPDSERQVRTSAAASLTQPQPKFGPQAS
jgi:hypothetical protein